MLGVYFPPAEFGKGRRFQKDTVCVAVTRMSRQDVARSQARTQRGAADDAEKCSTFHGRVSDDDSGRDPNLEPLLDDEFLDTLRIFVHDVELHDLTFVIRRRVKAADVPDSALQGTAGIEEPWYLRPFMKSSQFDSHVLGAARGGRRISGGRRFLPMGNALSPSTDPLPGLTARPFAEGEVVHRELW
jgi:hypothetical protein